MKAGRLSERFVFQKRTVMTDSDGVHHITWAEEFTVWGEFQRDSELTARFIVRYRSDIRPDTHRIVFEGARWTITAVIHDRKRTMLTITSDGSDLIESTDLEDTTRQFIDGVPERRPPES
jgi:head-tail adaptor